MRNFKLDCSFDLKYEFFVIPEIQILLKIPYSPNTNNEQELLILAPRKRKPIHKK